MATDPKPDDKGNDPTPPADPDAGAKKALDEERRARRDAEKQLRDIQAKLKEFEDRDKSESEKLSERIAAAERRAAEAEAKALRFEVATEKGVKARWLSGVTREELEAAADEYLADHPSAGNGGGPAAPTKPVEDLRGGGEPVEGPEPDIRKIVESIPRGI